MRIVYDGIVVGTVMATSPFADRCKAGNIAIGALCLYV